ncbi:hypothetical protein FBQ82_11570 [Anaerolineae bacterium CFX7]|nr:hypothetical protein [Anaerolineae bacterium CFX7]
MSAENATENTMQTALPPEQAERAEFETAAYLFNVVEAQITRADTKAGLVIAADSVFATALLLISRGALLALFMPNAAWFERLNALTILIIFGLLLASTLSALIATRPALRAPQADGTLFFFGRIARMEPKHFVASFHLQATDELRQALLTEVHNTSKIAARKFRLMRYSIDCLIGAVGLWIIIQIIYGLTRQSL